MVGKTIQNELIQCTKCKKGNLEVIDSTVESVDENIMHIYNDVYCVECGAKLGIIDEFEYTESKSVEVDIFNYEDIGDAYNSVKSSAIVCGCGNDAPYEVECTVDVIEDTVLSVVYMFKCEDCNQDIIVSDIYNYRYSRVDK